MNKILIVITTSLLLKSWICQESSSYVLWLENSECQHSMETYQMRMWKQRNSLIWEFFSISQGMKLKRDMVIKAWVGPVQTISHWNCVRRSMDSNKSDVIGAICCIRTRSLNFIQCRADTCLYWKRLNENFVVVVNTSTVFLWQRQRNIS